MSTSRGPTAGHRTTGTCMLVVVTVLALAIVLGGLVVAAANRHHDSRRQRLVAWARNREWSHDDRPVPAWPWTARLPGRNRHGVSPVMSGLLEDVPVTLAEYWYRSSRDNRGGSTHHLVVALVRLPEPHPPVEVAP